MMPMMDGAAFMKALADEPSFASIPVLVMSSLPEEIVAERCPGYAKFIRKPFSIFEVIDIVQRLTGTSEGESQPIP
jgi:CheY-like chemotaxis protein